MDFDVIKEHIREVENSRISRDMSRLFRIAVEDLEYEGFTRDEAIKIATSHNFKIGIYKQK